MSRPTPVVPATEELRQLGARSRPPDLGSLVPRPSARPTASPAAPSAERRALGADDDAPIISVAPAEEEPATISSRPTLAEAPTSSAPPTDPAPPVSHAPMAPGAPSAPAPPANSLAPAPNEKAFFDSAPGPAMASVPPSVRPARRPSSRARTVFAKILFVTMFAGVATLLGLAIKTKLDAGALPSLPSALTR